MIFLITIMLAEMKGRIIIMKTNSIEENIEIVKEYLAYLKYKAKACNRQVKMNKKW